MKVFGFLFYLVLQILILPLTILGLIDGAYKELVIGKKMGISYSAGQTLQYRVFMHYFGSRQDPYTINFTRKFPCESLFGLWSVFGAFFLARKYLGFSTKLNEIPEDGRETLGTTAGKRVLLFDGIMEKYIDQVEQVVLPGVGFDLIAHHFTESKGIRVFEIDQTNTIKVKVDTLDKAGINHEWITYIPVDYHKEAWSDKLLEAGFVKGKKTLFLWQSVSHFLSQDQVKECLEIMKDFSGPGSMIVQDFYSDHFIHHNNEMAVKKQKSMMAKRGEPWIFGIDMSENPKESVGSFLNSCGLDLTDYHQFGKELNIEPFYCIVESYIS